MKKYLFLLIAPFIYLAEANAQGKLSKANYTLVWSDEFNYPDVEHIPTNRWQIKSGPFNGNSTSDYTSENIYFKDGIMRLKTAKATNGQAGALPYTGAMLELIADVDKQDGPCDWWPSNWYHGVQFGMIEIRCKLPALPGACPAFWLVNPDTELDIIDNGSLMASTKWSSGVLDWRKQNTKARASWADWTCGGQAIKDTLNGSHDLSREYNTYTLVWTQKHFSIFLNGREQYTVPDSVVRTDYLSRASHLADSCTRRGAPQHRPGYGCTATLRVGVGTYGDILNKPTPRLPPASFVEDYLDVDYIKIYKPKKDASPDDYYENPQEYRSYKVSGAGPEISAAPGAIATNFTNLSEVFFRGADNALYVAKKQPAGVAGSPWTTALVDAHQAAQAEHQNQNWLISGDVCFNQRYGLVTYAGADGNLQQYNYQPDASHSWTAYHHGWLNQNAPADELPLGTARTMAAAANGDIYYIGQDHAVQVYHLAGAGGRWEHSWVGYNYQPDDLAMGDLVLEEKGELGVDIYYKGMNQRVQTLHCNQGDYEHVNIDNTTYGGSLVAKAPGSMTVGTDSNIFYVGADGNMHRYFLFGGWKHEKLMLGEAALAASLVAVPAVEDGACKPHPQGTIAWNAAKQQVIYVGLDGRLRNVHNTYSDALLPGTWATGWIDDYFNTSAYLSVVPVAKGAVFHAGGECSAVAAGADGSIFYRCYDQQLRCFVLADSQYINPNCTDLNRPVSYQSDEANRALLIAKASGKQ